MCCSTDIFLGLLAILFPPLPVWVKTGICSADSLINILLCMLGILPGLIHAWYIIAKYPEPDWEHDGPYDAESRRVYVFVQGPPNQPQPHAAQPQRQPPHGGMSYGTTGAGPSSSAAPAAQAGEGSRSDAPPPSYAQVVAGDNKIQTQD